MSTDARAVFADIDKMQADAFLQHLTPDVHFTFGNLEPADGREAVRGAVESFWATISGMRHHVRDIWQVTDDTTVVHADVEYRRTDGKVVTVPNVDILRWEGDQVADWRIVIDIAPVYA